MAWVKGCHFRHAAARDATAALEQVDWDEVKDKLDVRIGSESSYGKVYRVTLKGGTAVAVKVWKDEPAQNNDEVGIARRLGRLAEEDPNLPYPIVKGAGDLPGQRHYLISELAVGDINQMFAAARKNKADIGTWAAAYENWDPVTTLAEWKAMIMTRVQCAVNQMHADGYAHMDAHRNNFMCLKSGKVVIHDFGTSETITPEGVRQDKEHLQDHFGGWQARRAPYVDHAN